MPKIKCTCLATPVCGKRHDRLCPRYKAYIDRIARAEANKARDARFESACLKGLAKSGE